MGNFKKISAVAVAGAIMLSSVVPTFASTYAPVNGDKASVLNQLELYAGTSDSSFVPSLDTALTRGQGATLLSKLFNMDSAALALTDAEADAILKDFADADKVPTYAKKRLAYLVKNNIMSGSKDTTTGKVYVNADEALLGGQFATLILKQLGYTVSSWNGSVDQLSKVDGAKDIANYLSYATKSVLRDQAVGLMFGSLTSEYADGKATIIDKLVEAKPSIKAVAQNAGLVTVPTALAVESVTALNAKQIQVKFNIAVDKDSAEDENFYEVKDKGTNVIALGANSAQLVDDKTVILTLDANATDKLTNVADAKVTVKKDLKAASNLTLAADYVNSAVKVSDAAIPAVTKVEAIGDATIKMTFSEPVYDGSDLSIYSQNFSVKSGTYTYFVQNAVADSAKKTITLTLGTKLIDGPVTVTVNDAGIDIDGANGAIRDYAGYRVFKADTTFNYVKDTSVAVVSIKEAKQDSVTLKFSKPVMADGLYLYHSVNGVDAYKSVAATTTGAYADEITFSFSNKIPTGNVKLFLVNSTDTTKQLVDGYGIKVPDQTLNTTIVNDVTGPVVVSTKAIDNTSYEIVFDEAIDETAAKTDTNYTVKSVADGKDVPFTVNYDKAVNAKKVTLNIPGNFGDNAQYQVVVKAMKDLAGNSMTSQASYTFAIGDYKNPNVASSYAINADGKIYITFDEAMNQAQMAVKTNYLVKTDAAAQYVALGTNDTVTVLSNKTVLITLSGKVLNAPSVSIAGVTDLAGKKLVSDAQFVCEVTNIAQETVGIAKAELIAKNKIKLTFNKELSNFNNAEFNIFDHTTGVDFVSPLRIAAVESITKNSDGNTEVVVLLNTSVNTDASFESDRIDVVTVDSPANTKSISGTVLAGSASKTVEDKVAAEVAKYDDNNPATENVADVSIGSFSVAPLNGRVANGTTATVSIKFTEAMNLASMSTLTFSVEGYTVTNIALNGSDSSIVELTVSANADNTLAKSKVTQNYNITDASTNNNVFAAGSVWNVR